MKLQIILVLFVLLAVLHESQSAPEPTKHKEKKEDPYKPIIRILKELRKQKKYEHKYGGGGSRPWSHDSSEESSEENPFFISGSNHRPNRPYGSSNNRPYGSSNGPSKIFPLENSGGIYGGNNEAGAGQPLNPGIDGGNGGQFQNPIEQVDRGVSSFIEGLHSLVRGAFNFPSN